MELVKELRVKWKRSRASLEDRMALVIMEGVKAHGWVERFEYEAEIKDWPPGIDKEDLPWTNVGKIFCHEVPWWHRKGVSSNNALAAWVIDESALIIEWAVGEWLGELTAETEGPTDRTHKQTKLFILWSQMEHGMQQKEIWRQELLQGLSKWTWVKIIEAAERARTDAGVIGLPSAVDMVESLVADTREFLARLEARVNQEAVVSLICGTKPLVFWVKQADTLKWGPPVEVPDDLNARQIWGVPDESGWWRSVLINRLTRNWGERSIVLMRTRVAGPKDPWGVIAWQFPEGRRSGLVWHKVDKQTLARHWQSGLDDTRPGQSQEHVLFLD